MTLPATSGVYKITCTANNRFYVGSSKNIQRRIQVHKHQLRANAHHNPHLQNCFNKYGVGSFTFEVVELCPASVKFEREQYYFDTLQPELNTLKTATGGKDARPVYQIDNETGEIIQCFVDVETAAKSLGLKRSAIYRAAKLDDRTKTAGGYAWAFDLDDDLDLDDLSWYDPAADDYDGYHHTCGELPAGLTFIHPDSERVERIHWGIDPDDNIMYDRTKGRMVGVRQLHQQYYKRIVD